MPPALMRPVISDAVACAAAASARPPIFASAAATLAGGLGTFLPAAKEAIDFVDCFPWATKKNGGKRRDGEWKVLRNTQKKEKYAQEKKLKQRAAYNIRAMNFRKKCASAKKRSRIG